MYDIIIIGAGSGGYIAAERAGENGKSVLLVEKAFLGGVCLNEGCIPAKTLLNSAKLFHHAKNGQLFGVHVQSVEVKWDEVLGHKNSVIETLRAGIAFLMKKYKVDVIQGNAVFIDPKTIEVDGKRYEGQNLVIATGSSTFIPRIPGVQGNPHVVTSTEILSLETLPKSLVVIGGGVIGIECASCMSLLGVQVTVIEMRDEIIPYMDSDVAKHMRRALPDVNFILGAKVERIENGIVYFNKGNKTESITSELILMSVGRSPNINNLGLEKTGLDYDSKGIRINDKMQTNVPGIYAIGDVTGKLLLAHAASRMAEVAINVILGKNDRMRYHAVPWAVYSFPEAAGVGMTEDEAIKNAVPYKTATMHMRVNGRFIIENGLKAPGLCKVIVHKDKGTLLGVHLLGPMCSEMIFGATALIESELRVDDIKEIVFPHPSISEIIRDTLSQLK